MTKNEDPDRRQEITTGDVFWAMFGLAIGVGLIFLVLDIIQ